MNIFPYVGGKREKNGPERLPISDLFCDVTISSIQVSALHKFSKYVNFLWSIISSFGLTQ